MFSVAFVGPDGAGKTTIARRLESSLPFPVKYLYMGVNTESSNVALPTSRLAHRLKRRASQVTSQAGAWRSWQRELRAILRLLNRLAEEWFRQLVAWYLQSRGYVVLYDRHFKFDFDPFSGAADAPAADRLHRWLLARLYPTPEEVIYLDAPADVLFARKGEATIEWLELRRAAMRRTGHTVNNFLEVDAAQAPDIVYATVRQHLIRRYEERAGVSGTKERPPAPVNVA